jgi:hypothetical protein
MNWLPNPLSISECVPPPPGTRVDTLPCGGEGGGSQFRRPACNSGTLSTLCLPWSSPRPSSLFISWHFSLSSVVIFVLMLLLICGHRIKWQLERPAVILGWFSFYFSNHASFLHGSPFCFDHSKLCFVYLVLYLTENVSFRGLCM